MSKYSNAHTTAGHEALRVVEKHGDVEGEQIIAGYAVAFARALCALRGVNGARRFLDEKMPRPDPERIKLVG